MTTKGFTLAISSLAIPLQLICCGASAAGDANFEDGYAQLRLIVEEQQQNLAKIHSIKFSARLWMKTLTPGHEYEGTNERQVVRRGDWGWCELRVRWAEGAANSWQEAVSRTVWNDRYLVHAPMDHAPIAYFNEYDSLESLPESAQKFKALAGVDPEWRYAFGTGSTSLATLAADRKKYPYRYEVTRESSEGKGAPYLIKAWGPLERPYPAFLLTVDPARGYMVTRGTRRMEDVDQILREFTVTPSEVAPGIWYPAGWKETRYGPPDPATGQQPVNDLYQVDISNIQVNADLPDSQFTWQTLALRPDTLVFRTDATGEIKRMRIANGELVPTDLNSSKH